MILNSNQQIKVKSGQSILDALKSSKVEINHECGGNGTCTTCLIITHSDEISFSPRTEIELERSEERNFKTNERLSCQTYLLQSAVIEIPSNVLED